MPEIIEQIGAYAGFAAVLGLAVLSALYFSQARDVKRLREWAGRAPEREPAERAALQERAAAAAAAAEAAQQRPQPAAQQQPAQQQAGQQQAEKQQAGQQGGKPAPASPAAAATATASPAPPPAAAPGEPGAAKPPAAKPAAARPATANGGPTGPGGAGGPGGPARPGGPAKAPPIGAGSRPPAGQPTAILPASALRPTPWYRRLEPRYLVVLIAGVLIVGGAAAFGVTQLGGEDTASTPAAGAGEAPQDAAAGGDAAAAPSPSDVTVAVLNGTTVTGLASQFGDALEEAGYDVGNITNALDQAKAESVVLYADGARPEARLVAEDLQISQTERADADSQQLGGNASVIVVLGADKTP